MNPGLQAAYDTLAASVKFWHSIDADVVAAPFRETLALVDLGVIVDREEFLADLNRRTPMGDDWKPPPRWAFESAEG